ncbi:MAG: hypothetical protein IPJ81_16320 [Chitinophagaceae bacterium]|nr:hypothetical protein [Chitinophagaceae bacterium]
MKLYSHFCIHNDKRHDKYNASRQGSKKTTKLKQEVLQVINCTSHRLVIAFAMGVGEEAVKKYIRNNDPKLTQYAPLQVIKNIMNVSNESELLTEN